MAKKKAETEKVEVQNFEVRNLKEVSYSVQIYNDEGQVEYLAIRIQGRRGQKPPVIASTAVTDHIRSLEKKGFLKLVEVKE